MKTKLLFKFILLFSIISCGSKSTLKPGNYRAEIDGILINYTIAGKGPVMMAGHPNSGKTGYELTLKPLEKKFTMIYYDPRGTGKSGVPKKIEDYNSDHLTNEIDLLRQKLNIDKIWIFGHSDQSAIALQYAVEHPENISGLILSGTSLTGTFEEMVSRRKITERQRKSESAWFSQVITDWDYMLQNNTNNDKNGRNLSDSPLKWWIYNEETFLKIKPIVDVITKTGRRKPIDDTYYYETEDQREKYLELQKKFKNLKTKILIINGRSDTNNAPQYAATLEKTIPDSKLIIIEKAGHFPWIEQPERTFFEIDQWLNN